jgi:hypothetical protein
MSGLIRALQYSAPISLIAFFWLTMQTVNSYSDESMTSYGFPLAYYARSNISSMTYDLAIIPFILDLTFYALTCHCIILAIPASKLFSNKHNTLFSLFLWLIGLGLMGFASIVIFLNAHYVTWKLDEYFSENTHRSYQFHFGPGFTL